jgi:hypothetical protein
MSEIKFYRYKNTESITTALDPFADIIDWLRYLTADDYVVNLLIKVHKLTPSEAKTRCKLIMPHIRDALAFIDQAIGTPNEAAFVSIYYAMLNLAKVSVLVGPRHADLFAHRWHGVTYEVNAKVSQSVLTEEIILKRGGALALFYETLMERPWPSDRRVKMSELYPYLVDVSHEYFVATGQRAKFAGLSFEPIAASPKKIRVKITAHPRDSTTKLLPRQISSAQGLKIQDADKNIFISNKSYQHGTTWNEIFESHFDRRFIIKSSGTRTEFLVGCRRFAFTEELPIILVFFHLSSVVRYKPEFLYAITDSKIWPVISTARRHCFYKFLLLFWSHIHQTNYSIEQR